MCSRGSVKKYPMRALNEESELFAFNKATPCKKTNKGSHTSVCLSVVMCVPFCEGSPLKYIYSSRAGRVQDCADIPVVPDLPQHERHQGGQPLDPRPPFRRVRRLQLSGWDHRRPPHRRDLSHQIRLPAVEPSGQHLSRTEGSHSVSGDDGKTLARWGKYRSTQW